MQIVTKNVADLIFAEYNPRQLTKKQHKDLTDSIKRFGLVDPILINIHQDRKNIIIGGHQRVRIAQELGIMEVPCVELELNPAKEKELNVRLNKNLGEWDFDILANNFEVDDLMSWGFDVSEIGMFKEENSQARDDDYEIPDDIETDICLGDVIEIGRHKLMCGDATKNEDVQKIMLEENADMVFTDPPYDIDDAIIYSHILFISKDTNILIFVSDKQIPLVFSSDIGEFKRLYPLQLNIASPTNNDVYINHIALLRFKIGNPIGFNNLHNGGRSIVKTKYRKNLGEESLHKHQKSVETIGLFLKYWSDEGNLICDFFGGSGTTMVAAQQLGRRCFMMELEPKNCQVIVDRMKALDETIKIKKLNNIWLL